MRTKLTKKNRGRRWSKKHRADLPHGLDFQAFVVNSMDVYKPDALNS